MKKEKTHAVLTIKDAAKMNKRQKKEIANWLTREAKNLIKEGERYSGKFTARYIKP